jgi:hypothetical protein
MALLLRMNMVAKFCAVWLVVLSALPFTAPFSTFDTAGLFAVRHTDDVIGTLPIQASPTDHDDALALERSDFLRQSRLCALVVVASSDTAPVLTLLPPSVAPTALSLDDPPLRTILRL